MILSRHDNSSNRYADQKALFSSISAGTIISVLFCFMLLLIVMPEVAYADYADNSKSIMILHSYDQGLPWTNDQNAGILDVLESADEQYNLFIEYMDWKNYPSDENLEQLKQRFEYKYSGRKIDLIITTDDAALEFALDNRKEIFSDAPVVFSGVNKRGAEEITYGHSAVTGVIEEIDPARTLKIAIRINPDIKRIYLLFDNTESGLTTGEITVNAIKDHAPQVEIITLNGIDTERILEAVSQAEDDSIVIATTYTASMNGDMLGVDYFCRMLCQNSRVPVYHLYDLGLGNGAVGGSMIIGRLQGEESAQIALRILQGDEISGIPFVSKTTTRYMFDYKALQRFEINTSLLPEGSHIINKPFSSLQDHRGIVLAVVIAFVMLFIFISILLFYLKRLQVMRRELSENNMQLTGLYEDLTIASKKLKKQYDELITVQNDLSSSEYKLELLFDKMINGFFIFEPVLNAKGKLVDIKFLRVTPGFFQNLDIEEQEVTGKTWFELFGTPNRELAYFQNLLESGRAERFEAHDAQRDNYYLVEPFLISENQVGVIFENITAYRKALREVKLLNANLEKRVADRTSKLQEAIEELESFSYTVSHDLKSPLRAVDGYVDILLEDFGDKLDSDAVQMLQNISTISRESIDMINKILQYSKTSRATMNREPLDMEKGVMDVFNELVPAYSDRDIELVIETGMPEVYVDRILFRQLLLNILSNSIKFTSVRDKAVITAGCTITEDSYVFYIKDNGVGFDMKYSGKLFGLFQRLHSLDEFEGSGIGLVTVKKIIEKHGGKVWIEGIVDEGSTVFFTVPIKLE